MTSRKLDRSAEIQNPLYKPSPAYYYHPIIMYPTMTLKLVDPFFIIICKKKKKLFDNQILIKDN